MIQSSAQNHIFYDYAQSAKGCVRNYILRIYVCAYPHLAGVGSRAISSRTTTTHPALRWAPYLNHLKKGVDDFGI